MNQIVTFILIACALLAIIQIINYIIGRNSLVGKICSLVSNTAAVFAVLGYLLGGLNNFIHLTWMIPLTLVITAINISRAYSILKKPARRLEESVIHNLVKCNLRF